MAGNEEAALKRAVDQYGAESEQARSAHAAWQASMRKWGQPADKSIKDLTGKGR